MFTFLVILTVIFYVLLVVAASIRPRHSVVSEFELERRAKRASKEAKATLHRERLLPSILTLQRLVVALLLVIVVLLLVVTFGWLIGVILAVVVALEYALVARFAPLARQADRLYEKIEPWLLRFVEKAQPVLDFLRTAPTHDVNEYRRFDSREELQQLVAASGDILSAEERKIIVNGLAFKDQRVETIMTPRGMINTIKKGEFLGPLVLSELHDMGHSRLPVISSDLDHIVGVLHLRDLLSLDVKQSVTVEKAMEPKVFYIRADHTLEHALAAFIKTRHHLFIVINKDRETVGLLTLEDVIEALIGRTILDEDDDHADVKSVSNHESEPNNRPDGRVDV